MASRGSAQQGRTASLARAFAPTLHVPATQQSCHLLAAEQLLKKLTETLASDSLPQRPGFTAANLKREVRACVPLDAYPWAPFRTHAFCSLLRKNSQSARSTQSWRSASWINCAPTSSGRRGGSVRGSGRRRGSEPDEALKAVAINEQSRIPEVKFRIFRNSGTLHGKLLLPVDEPLAVTALASPLGLVAQAEEELLVGQDRQSRQS